MCHLTIGVDQAIHTVAIANLIDAIEQSPFYIRSIRVIPVVWSKKADVCLSLGGGSPHDLDGVLETLRKVSGVIEMHHTMPPIEV